MVLWLKIMPWWKEINQIKRNRQRVLMAKKMRKLLVVSVIILSCVSAMAQGETTILTFQDAVRSALMNSVTLNQQKNQLELNQVQKNSAIAQIAPNISLNGSATQINGNSFNQQQGRVIN